MTQTDFPKVLQLSIEESPSLNNGEVHVYVVSIQGLRGRYEKLQAYINSEEEKRAARFINPQHGVNYRCIRGQLRKWLAAYLSIRAEDVEFDYAEHGKPFLKDHAELHFNLSHSKDIAVFAFTRHGEIGVDVEYMRPQHNLAGMIRRVASAREAVELAALNESDSLPAFYRLWTRKEAFIKAVGRGLGMGLHSIHVGTRQERAAIPVSYREEVSAGWHVLDLEAPENYGMALCAKV